MLVLKRSEYEGELTLSISEDGRVLTEDWLGTGRV